MIELLLSYTLPAAYALLPPAMGVTPGPQASALLMAIGLQESRFLERRQFGNGPARGFWMFEPAGVAGVLHHRNTALPITEAAAALRYTNLRNMAPSDICDVLEHNDVLAACFARCLLWTYPGALPTIASEQDAWTIYTALWRPGRPRQNTWSQLYAEAWQRVAFSPLHNPDLSRA